MIQMTLNELFNSISINQGFWLVLVFTLVEIAPIKINPWKTLFKYIGKITNSELIEKVDEMQGNMKRLKRDFELKCANDKRWDILDFANACRNGRRHDKEEWEHVISQLKEYESYVEKYNIDNGVIEEDTRYLRELYQEKLSNNDFL